MALGLDLASVFGLVAYVAEARRRELGVRLALGASPRRLTSAFIGKLLEEQDGDVLREGIRVLSQALMETEVAGLLGADRHERTPERTGHRNGYPMRT